MMISPSRYAPALVTALALSACTSSHRGAVQTTPPPATRREANSSAVARAQADSVRHPYVQADVDFMSHMISHHAQAIVMSGWAPSNGASPSVRTLASRIINAQQDEIASMQQWLRNRGKPVPEPALSLPNGASPTGMKMTMNGAPSASSGQATHEMLMPGMLTADQMKQLEQAKGPEFDRLFLTFMIQHHSGAVSMVKDLFGTNGAARDETVFKFANDVSVDQSTEIARMKRMLTALPPA